MPDQPDQPDQPEPTPGDEATLRRLLREARHDETIPGEVAERLDVALAAEKTPATPAGEHPSSSGDEQPAARGRAAAPVIGLDRRRRQRAIALLVAAATIVAVGVGVGRLLRPGVDATATSASDIDRQLDAGASEEKVERGDAADGQAAESDRLSGDAGSLAQGGGVGAAPDRALRFLPQVPEVSDDEFVRDVRQVRRLVGDAPSADRRGPKTFVCETTDWGRGTPVAVRYDQAPSVLVLRPPAGETQVAELLPCGGGDTLRSVTLPER